MPVVGGNVSLYNEGGGGPIYPTPVVGMVGQLPDPADAPRASRSARRAMQIALLGPFRPALAGSELEKLRGDLAGGLPDIDLGRRHADLNLLRATVRGGGLSSAHDVSDGGLACALAECCMAGGIGARVDLAPLLGRLPNGGAGDVALFGEGAGGVLISAPLETIEGLAEEAGGGRAARVWARWAATSLELTAGIATLSVSVEEARAAFQSGLPDCFS